MKDRRGASCRLDEPRRRRDGARRYGLLAFVALAGWLVAAALGAAGMAHVSSQPIKQFSDRLIGPDQRELAGLFVTTLEGEVSEISWGERSLPCAGHRYPLFSAEAAISSAYSSASHVQIAIESQHLTHGLQCGSKLPQDVQEGTTSVSVRSVDPSAQVGSPDNVYEDGETQIKSFSPCITLARACPGRYLLRAYLDAPRRRVKLEYVFAVLSSPRTNDPAPRD
jgi:hypothetical protein